MFRRDVTAVGRGSPIRRMFSMRRAAVLVAAILLAATPMVPVRADVDRAPDTIDGAGLLDYMQRPHFAVGNWVKYHTTSSSLRGLNDDYTVTILVAGEEVWWGDPCVWIETWTDKKGGHTSATASLVSYSAFGDTMSEKHILWFIRKTIDGFKADGTPDIALYARSKPELQMRRANIEQEEEVTRNDSLGADTTTVPAGAFQVFKVKRRSGHAQTAELGDSTTYYERRLDRVFYITSKVPITHVARIDIDDHQLGKTWLAGQFDKGPLKTLERAQGQTVLVGYGTGGLTPLLVPVANRVSIERKLVDAAITPMEPQIIQVKKSGSP
jgi:hypothetical protein